jgi:hypothetical protein
MLSYTARLAAAQRRLERAIHRRDAANTAISAEQARIYLYKAHVEADPGHILLPDPPLLSWAGRTEPAAPDCRLCGVTIASTAGRQPCPGDTRKCPAPVPVEFESGTTYRRYGEDDFRCGAGGAYADDYFSWTCVHGHQTTLTAATQHDRRICSHDPSKGYQLEGCLGDCPARGLNLTILDQKATVACV